MENPPVNTIQPGTSIQPRDSNSDTDSESQSQLSSAINDENNVQTSPLPPSSPPYNHKNSSPTLPNDPLSPSLQRNAPLSPEQSFQIHPKFLINPHATEASYFIRPNRYFGPDSTWRSWTEADRVVHHSLERMKAEDLSAHLYNAFALKQGALREKKARNKGKEKEKPDDEEPPFEPPERWTAWPLSPEEVPRLEFVRGLDGLNHSHKRRRIHWSRNELEECLIATAQRNFRESWKKNENERQEQDDKGDEDGDVSRSTTKREKKLQKSVEVEAEDVIMQDTTEPTRTENERSHSLSRSSSPSNPSDTSVAPLPKVAGVQYFSSQAFASSDSSSTSPTLSDQSLSDSEKDEDTTRLAPTIDDDYARDLLLPGTKHIISKFEDLLQALHNSQARKAYGRGPQRNPRSRSQSKSRSESKGKRSRRGNDETETEDQDNTSSSNEDRQETKQIKLLEPSSSRQRSHSKDPISKSRSQSRSNSRSQSHPRSKSNPLPLRTWKLIIQQASLLNLFTPTTISRAARRCADLFEEDIQIRTFHETEEDERGRTKMYTEVYHALDTSDEDEEDEGSSSSIDEDEYDQNTVEGADGKKTKPSRKVRIRTSAACTHCFTHKLKCKPPHPSLETDSLPPATTSNQNEPNKTTSCTTCLKQNELCSKIQYEDQIQTTTTTSRQGKSSRNCHCPHINCKRNTIPFNRMSDLRRHLKLAHDKKGEEESISTYTYTNTSLGRPIVQRSGSNISDQRVMVEMEIYCPVDGCSRAEGNNRPFKTTSKMYQHVRGSHPKLNVEEVKKMELIKRGDGRGRWTDERRHRSRSKAKSSDSRGEISSDD